jgi:hypothetical protein
VPKVYDLFKAMSPDAPVLRGNWAVFHDLDGVLDLYTPSGHVERNEVNSFKHVLHFNLYSKIIY